MKLLLAILGGAIVPLALGSIASANPYSQQRQIILVQPGYSVPNAAPVYPGSVISYPASRPIPVQPGPTLVLPPAGINSSVITFPSVGMYPQQRYYDRRYERPVYFPQTPTVIYTNPNPYWNYGNSYQQPTIIYSRPGFYGNGIRVYQNYRRFGD